MNDPRRKPAPAGFVPFTGDEELDRRLIEIEDALKAKQFEQAVEHANALLRERPDHAETKRLLAAALRGCDRDEEALQLLRELAEQEPDNALVHNSLGAALRMNGELDPARRCLPPCGCTGADTGAGLVQPRHRPVRCRSAWTTAWPPSTASSIWYRITSRR